MTTREPSNLLNHRVSRARKLPHGSRDRLAPGALDLVEGQAEQPVDLELAVIDDLTNPGDRYTVLLAQLLELAVVGTGQRDDGASWGLREEQHRGLSLGQGDGNPESARQAAFHESLRQAAVGQVVSAGEQTAPGSLHHE